MSESADWQYSVEVHPPGWRFPAGKSWLAGWVRPPAGQAITDIRARLHHRIILGLSGLPHPAQEKPAVESRCAVLSGFSFLFAPHPGASHLTIEARDLSGRWTELFGTAITPAAEAEEPANRPSVTDALPGLTANILRRQLRDPRRPWAALADELVASLAAEPLNAHPNPPLVGALEEPRETGRLRFGVISVTGWLAHPARRIERVAALIDPHSEAVLPHGLDRRDISGVFPALAGHAASAFVGEVALPTGLAEPVLLKIFADLEDGTRHLVFAQRFTPCFVGASVQLPPGVTGLTLARVFREVFRAARRYALPRRGLVRAGLALWTAYRAQPAYAPPRRSRPGPAPRILPIGSPFRGPAGDEPGAGVSRAIAPGDDMFVTDATQYLRLGREALQLVQEAGTLANSGKVETILDLPSGSGRVARWLRAAYPAARLVACDTQGPAVEFCAAELGAIGVQATIDGRHWLQLPGPFDIIWCGSLLTHFDRAQWIDHLRRFAERLGPRGVLVFTSHGRHALDKLQSGEKDYGLPADRVALAGARAVAEGFGYVDYPESPGYGISVALPAWILELIARETHLHVLQIREAAWDQHQDVVVCTRRRAT